MNIEGLKIFLAVAETGSFSEAARRLFISHSTVSRAVAALEERVGARLVSRRGNAVFGLTPAGERLKARGRELLALTDEIINELRELEKVRLGDKNSEHN